MAKLIEIEMLQEVAGLKKGDKRTINAKIAATMIANKTAKCVSEEDEEYLGAAVKAKEEAQAAANEAAEEANEKREAAEEERKIKEAIDATIASGDRGALESYTKVQLLPFALGNNGIGEDSKKAEIVEALISDENCTSC